MPYSPNPACKIQTCPNKAYKWGYCKKHFEQYSKHIDKERGSSTERGYNGRWQKARKMFLAEHPFCAECEKESRVTAATLVDHIIPHRGDMDLFWDSKNWQSLCTYHHNQKTAKETFGK